MKLLDVGRRESKETPEQTLARLNAQTRAATPVDHVPTKPSEGFGERLAHISQKQWRFVCVAVWLCIGMVAWTVYMLVFAYGPDRSSDDAMLAAVFSTFGASLIFWQVGLVRTNHISPNKWTTLQCYFKRHWDHPGS